MNKFNQILLLSLSIVASNHASAQSIIPWTEHNSVLGLGYPVPIPVDTPEPFDGFRTYAGLFAKHQSMAMNNDYINGTIVGQTHYNRDIWAYVLSDEDETTVYGVKEGAMMINGGIHAREWQSPETLTQIISDFHDNSADASFYQYLLENAAIITVPVNNVDGFLQTQRYPSDNWLGADPTVPATWPRDGRMRRKNLLNTDEDLSTVNDHLNGVDLNRNNNPYWATSGSSSSDVQELRYHGPVAQSEPETLARINAANLVDADQLRIYTDVHSFSQVHFSELTFNQNRNALQTRVLSDFTRHHREFPLAKNYVDINFPAGGGIGSTDEYFAVTYEIPSWTLEIEPSRTYDQNEVDRHPELPGVGADYGGFANNGHDGFILPDSEIKRVREQLAESFMVAWYGQAGPPSITQLRIIDIATNAIVYDAEWDMKANGQRELYSHYFDEILSGQDYALLVRFDKPMRYRNSSDEVVALQGQSTSLNPVIQATSGDQDIGLNLSNHRWVNEKSSDWESYAHYKDDTFVVEFNVDAEINAADDAQLNWKIITTDMIGQSIDADPSTVVTWAGGQWQNYEDSNGNSSINGGFDTTISVTISNQASGPNSIVPLTALYFDPARPGEGFNLELTSTEAYLMQWYTFDEAGNPKWFIASNNISAQNAFFAPEILTAEGGVFGPDFDPDAIQLLPSGSVEMIFETIELNGDTGNLSHIGQMKYTYPDGRKFRTQLEPVAAAKGISSISNLGTWTPRPGLTGASIIGSWYDPFRNGEGFHIQETTGGNAVILWYSYGPDGGQEWFIGSGGFVTETDSNININFSEVYQVRGGQFGDDFNPDNIELILWGEVELNLQCTTGSIRFAAIDDDYGSDTYQVEPITRPVANANVCSD